MKEKTLLVSLNILFGLTLVSLLLFGGLLLWAVAFDAPSPSAASQPPASDLELRVKALETDLDSLQRDLVFRLDQKLFYFGGLALLISAAVAFFGWKSYKDLDEVIREKVRVTLENELYQLDPSNLTVRLPKGHPDSDLIRKRLELCGLHNITEYLELNKNCTRGLTVVPVNNLEEEDRFRGFLKRERPDPELAAFVLYTTADPREFRVSVPETLNQYERVAAANMPATVITAVLAVSRGLHREKK